MAGARLRARRRCRRSEVRLPHGWSPLHLPGSEQDELPHAQPGALRRLPSIRFRRRQSRRRRRIPSRASRLATGFEIERLYLGVDDGVSYNVVLNFDSDNAAGVEKEFMYLDAARTTFAPASTKCHSRTRKQNSNGALALLRSPACKAFVIGSDTGASLWATSARASVRSSSCRSSPQHRARSAPCSARTRSGRTRASSSSRASSSGRSPARIGLRPACSRPCNERPVRTRASACAGTTRTGRRREREVAGATSPCAPRGPCSATPSAPGSAPGGTAGLRVAHAQRRLHRRLDCAHSAGLGAELTVHYWFADSNWGVGAKAGVLWLDSDYKTPEGGQLDRPIADTISEYGLVANYFF